jgi:hypothetical protein
MKWDFETDNKQAKRILKLLEVWIIKNYGERCKAYAPRCSSCAIWTIYDLLKLHL